MTKNRIIAVGGGLIALGTIGMVMNHGASPVALRAAGGPTVTIENPLPLPVTGGVSITGTPNVNVANTPNVNVNNTPNVHVTNSPTVQVGNSSASPVPTVATDNPALQAFQYSNSSSTIGSQFTVPAGKTLVIEQVSFTCLEPVGSTPTDFRMGVTVGGVSADYLFAPTIFSVPGTLELIYSQPAHIYASGGSNVTFGTGSGVGNNSHCVVNVSGHLVSPL